MMGVRKMGCKIAISKRETDAKLFKPCDLCSNPQTRYNGKVENSCTMLYPPVIKRGLLKNPPSTSMIFPAINLHLRESSQMFLYLACRLQICHLHSSTVPGKSQSLIIIFRPFHTFSIYFKATLLEQEVKVTGPEQL